MKHLVVFSDSKIEGILNGEIKYELRFFKKRPEFLEKLNLGDLIYFKKSRGEILGQFSVGKIILVENLEDKDWGWIEKVLNHESRIMNHGKEQNHQTPHVIARNEVTRQSLTKENFEELAHENNTLVIIQIEKLEQLITSPIEMPKGRKEWIVLED